MFGGLSWWKVNVVRAGVIIIFYLILYSSSPIFNFSHVAAASFVFLVYPVGQGDLNSFILSAHGYFRHIQFARFSSLVISWLSLFVYIVLDLT